jgi:hypothetical protein
MPQHQKEKGKEWGGVHQALLWTEREFVRIKEQASRDQSGRCHAAISTAKRTCHTKHLDTESEVDLPATTTFRGVVRNKSKETKSPGC